MARHDFSNFSAPCWRRLAGYQGEYRVDGVIAVMGFWQWLARIVGSSGFVIASSDLASHAASFQEWKLVPLLLERIFAFCEGVKRKVAYCLQITRPSGHSICTCLAFPLAYCYHTSVVVLAMLPEYGNSIRAWLDDMPVQSEALKQWHTRIPLGL